MKHHILTLAALAFLIIPFIAHADAPPPPEMAKAFFVNLKDGDTVQNPVKIQFGISGMEIAPAGTDKPNTGHFHLLIDTQLTDAQKQLPIPNDPQHMHFGKGQTDASITLSPGKHTLQIVMGDGKHKLHNPPVMSDVITVIAK